MMVCVLGTHCNDSRPRWPFTKNMLLDGWYGKIIGAILGYIIGRGLFGAIVGLVLGHQFDVATRRNRSPTSSSGPSPSPSSGPGDSGAIRGDPAELRRAFFEATFLVMGHVAKSDGRVSQQEIGAAREAMRRFSLNEADQR